MDYGVDRAGAGNGDGVSDAAGGHRRCDAAEPAGVGCGRLPILAGQRLRDRRSARGRAGRSVRRRDGDRSGGGVDDRVGGCGGGRDAGDSKIAPINGNIMVTIQF